MTVSWWADRFQWVFLAFKYIILWSIGWFLPSVVTGLWFVGLATVLFVLFDLCALALWMLFKKSEHSSVLQQLSFYITQCTQLALFFVVFFAPYLIADLATGLLELVLK